VRSSPVARWAVTPAGGDTVSLPDRAVAGFEAERGDSAVPHSEQKFWPGAVT
jgi:hypothetical protein